MISHYMGMDRWRCPLRPICLSRRCRRSTRWYRFITLRESLMYSHERRRDGSFFLFPAAFAGWLFCWLCITFASSSARTASRRACTASTPSPRASGRAQVSGAGGAGAAAQDGGRAPGRLGRAAESGRGRAPDSEEVRRRVVPARLAAASYCNAHGSWTRAGPGMRPGAHAPGVQ